MILLECKNMKEGKNMNKIKKYVFVFFMIFLLAGCNKTTTTSNKTEDVTDETVISLLQNKITILENLDKTKEKKGKDFFLFPTI